MQVAEGFVKSSIVLYLVDKAGYIEVTPDNHFGQVDHFGQALVVQGILSFLGTGSKTAKKK